jgi:CRISPR-associated protein Cas2
MILEKVPKSLRGELSRWMLEVSTGLFVGSMTALVRDLLWEKCLEKSRAGRCCQIYHANNEQGFEIRMEGDSNRSLIDFDGLIFVSIKNAAWEESVKVVRE